MLARRGFVWLIAAALAGLLPALMVASQAARHALEGAALEQLAGHAAVLAATLQSPSPPALPAHAVIYAADGSAVAGDPSLVDHLAKLDLQGRERVTRTTAATERQVKGLLAAEPLQAGAGAVPGWLVLWRPAVHLEVRLATIMLGGLLHAGLLLLVALPAAWIGTRLLLAPIGTACAGSVVLLDRLREADNAAEEADQSLDAATLFAESSGAAGAEILAVARAAAAMIAQIDTIATAMARAEAEAALP